MFMKQVSRIILLLITVSLQYCKEAGRTPSYKELAELSGTDCTDPRCSSLTVDKQMPKTAAPLTILFPVWENTFDEQGNYRDTGKVLKVKIEAPQYFVFQDLDIYDVKRGYFGKFEPGIIEFTGTLDSYLTKEKQAVDRDSISQGEGFRKFIRRQLHWLPEGLKVVEWETIENLDSPSNLHIQSFFMQVQKFIVRIRFISQKRFPVEFYRVAPLLQSLKKLTDPA